MSEDSRHNSRRDESPEGNGASPGGGLPWGASWLPPRQPGRDSSATPPYTPIQPPTPPHQPRQPVQSPPSSVLTPAEKLAVRRWATGRKPQPWQSQSAFPDGVPAQLPRMGRFRHRRSGRQNDTGASASPASVSQYPDGTPVPLPTIGGRSGRVVQRFSGSGVAERSLTTRRERRARTATIALSIIAVALLVSSALFLFNPFLQNRGFGFALGYRYETIRTSDVLKIADDPPPVTPTPPAGAQPTPTPPTAQPTATPSTGGSPAPKPTAAPTATPRPTAVPTATPRPAPTPTPNPVGSGAVVTFTAANQSVQSQPASITDCGSGCTINAYQHLTNNITENNNLVRATGGQVATTTLKGQVSVSVTSISGPYPAPFTVYASVTLRASSGLSCTVDVGPVTLNGGAQPNIPCDTGKYSPLSTTFFGATGKQVCYGDVTPKQYQCTFTFSGPLSTNPKSPSVTYNDCHDAMDYLARTVGHNAMADWVNSNINAGWRLAASPSYTYGNWNCSPGIGSTTYPTPWFHAWDTTWVDAWTFNPAAAQNYAMNDLNNRLPSGYVWTASATGCPLSSSVSGSKITINCQYSRAAGYNWTQSLKDSLAQSLAKSNLDAAAAENICNNTPGVVKGSCKVTITNGTLMPSNYTSISFVIK